MLLVPRRHGELPQAPPDIQEEVELYARESGRTARLHFVPFGGWMARFGLRCNDKRMQLYQQGLAPEPPTEDVWFHVPNPKYRGPDGSPNDGQAPYIPLDIIQMGRSGVREFLERGNTWSGRGAHASLVEANKASEQAEADRKERLARNARERAKDIVKDRRRGVLGIPFVTVLSNLRNTKESKP